jgi:hypothetical protein
MKLHLLPAGSIGTPDFQEIIDALVMQAQATTEQRTIELVATPATAGSSAAALNAAIAGAFTKTVFLRFQDADGNVHTWINGTPVTLTPTEVAVDVHIGVPVVTGGNAPAFVDGQATVVLTYGTDGAPGAATKTYAIADTIGFTAACADILGISPEVSAGDFLDTIVA